MAWGEHTNSTQRDPGQQPGSNPERACCEDTVERTDIVKWMEKSYFFPGCLVYKCHNFPRMQPSISLGNTGATMKPHGLPIVTSLLFFIHNPWTTEEIPVKSFKRAC